MSHRLKRYAGIAAIVLLASMIAALLVGSVFQRAVAQPIVHLAELAGIVSRDKDYSVRATNRQRGRTRHLVRAFMRCWVRFKNARELCKEVHRDLEQRVEARTAQLADANKELERQNHEVERATRLRAGSSLA